MVGMQTETLLLVLLSTGLLIVLVLTSAILWVVLTILFKFRRTMRKTKSAAGVGLAALKGLKLSTPLAIAAAAATWFFTSNKEGDDE